MEQISLPGNTEEKKPAERRRFLAKILGAVAGAGILGGAGKLLAQVGKKSVDTSGNQKKVADSSPYLGEIQMVSFSFAPTGWALCNGQLLPISQYAALFNLIGTTYGGDGQITFALPDLRSRVPIHQGQGNGLSNRVMGQMSGEENHQLTSSEMPSHSHSVTASTSNGTSSSPSGNYPAVNNEGIQHYGTTSNGTMNASMIGNTGSSTSHNNMQPYTCVNFIIALSGIYPSQS
ncbi:MAG TPA: tail fiber protein [Candidatus Kryptonia bacterium]